MMRFASILIATSVGAFVPTPPRRHRIKLNAGEEPNLATKGAWFAAELAGKAKAALGGSMERGPATAAPKSVAELVKRIEADYEGEPYFLTGRMDAGCCQ